MSAPVVDIVDAGVIRRRRAVLHRVSLRIIAGEFIGILGPNGAGKTTLLMLVNGLLTPNQGQVHVLGSMPHRWSGYRLRRRIGYVAQVDRSDPRAPITVRETVAIGRWGHVGWLRRLGRSDWDKVAEALEWVGVGHLAKRPIGHLSGGEQQRVALARVLVQEPDIYLFDEPTASVDPRAQRDILSLVEKIHDRTRATTLFVTHDLGCIPERCDRLVLMKNGAIWKEGAPADMLAVPLLKDLYAPEGGNGACATSGKGLLSLVTRKPSAAFTPGAVGVRSCSSLSPSEETFP